MRGLLTFTAAAMATGLCAPPAFAQIVTQTVEVTFADADEAAKEQQDHQENAVIEGANAFFEALGSDDKTALATMMIPEATIFVHNRMDPENPRIDIVPVADHLARWANGTREVSERMFYRQVHLNDDLGYVEGPYSFSVEGQISHCGVNYLSMVKTHDGWKVGNTSFTMVPPDKCELVGAYWVDGQ